MSIYHMYEKIGNMASLLPSELDSERIDRRNYPKKIEMDIYL